MANLCYSHHARTMYFKWLLLCCYKYMSQTRNRWLISAVLQINETKLHPVTRSRQQNFLANLYGIKTHHDVMTRTHLPHYWTGPPGATLRSVKGLTPHITITDLRYFHLFFKLIYQNAVITHVNTQLHVGPLTQSDDKIYHYGLIWAPLSGAANAICDDDFTVRLR